MQVTKVSTCNGPSDIIYVDEPGKAVPVADANQTESGVTIKAVFDQEIGAYVLDNSVVSSEDEAFDVEFLDGDEVDNTTAPANPPPTAFRVSRQGFVAGTEDSPASGARGARPEWLRRCLVNNSFQQCVPLIPRKRSS